MPEVFLAATYHDPDGGHSAQVERTLPRLNRLFVGITVQATPITHRTVLALLSDAGARVQTGVPRAVGETPQVGKARREAVQMALDGGAEWVLYSDFDRALHWAEFFPEELERLITQPPDADCVVLGRTPRAYATHPRIQRDTEAIINHVYGLVSGQAWDMTAAARLLSRRAAEAVLADCPDDEISTDVSWPLTLLRAGGFTLRYLETEGLEFETADRHTEAISTLGRDAWMNRLDSDPRQWLQRLQLACLEVEAMLPYIESSRYCSIKER